MSLQQIVDNAYKAIAAAKFPIGNGSSSQQAALSNSKK
ncbi:hypothetical protein WP3W18E06_35190 [Raoultella ornithinolytica]|nr:hypothetical protein WP3W18E06_35190 [Raoultella ornithinolytica]